MRHALTVPKFAGLPEVRTYECRECGEAVTDVVKIEFGARSAQARH
jgi:hypothetical protein